MQVPFSGKCLPLQDDGDLFRDVCAGPPDPGRMVRAFESPGESFLHILSISCSPRDVNGTVVREASVCSQ